MPALQGEASEEARLVDNEQELAARSAGPGQPPRSQEGRRKQGRIHQLIPLRGPPAEDTDVKQAWRSHEGVSRHTVTIGGRAHRFSSRPSIGPNILTLHVPAARSHRRRRSNPP